jgi:uncharacterized OB-fold protein
MTSTTTRAIRPLPDAESGFFWAGAQQNRLMVQRCDECRRYQHPPRPACRHCLAASLTPTEVSGRGTVYTYTVTVQAFHPSLVDKVPYILAVVELAEQPNLKIITNLVDCTEDEVTTGMPVEVVFDHVDEELTLPKFRPARHSANGDHR